MARRSRSSTPCGGCTTSNVRESRGTAEGFRTATPVLRPPGLNNLPSGSHGRKFKLDKGSKNPRGVRNGDLGRATWARGRPNVFSQSAASRILALYDHKSHSLSGSGGETKRASSHVERATSKPANRRSPLGRAWRRPFARIRTLLRRPDPPAFFLRQPVAPSVVLACEQCGFDYTVSRIEVGGGKAAVVWSCDCGSRFIPPGGVPTSQLVRP